VPSILRTTAPVIAVGLFLAGCGGGSKGLPAAPPSGSTSATAPTTAASSAPSSAAKADSSSTKPRGSKVVVDQKNGYQIALPSGYAQITSKSQLTRMAKASASASKGKFGQQLLNKRVKLMAIDVNADRSLNVVVSPADGVTADQLPDLKPALKRNVEKLGAREITIKSATLGDDQALRGNYTLKVKGKKMVTVQYITVHDDRVYELTFAFFHNVSRKIEQQTVASWRFLQSDTE
jgi:hypothetical protein